MKGNDERGTVVVSIDAELGWGHHDLPDPPAARIEYARTGWQRLLWTLCEFDVAATWAVVGHLFLRECDGRHPDYPAPPGWFAREREEWRDRPELRFGRGLIERVTAAEQDHELACHGFAHVELGAPETTRELARAEVRASVEAADRSFSTYVFPRNYVGHRDVLAAEGITCYRGVAPDPSSNVSGARSARKLLRNLRGTTPPVVEPTRDEYGLVDVPPSLYLFEFERVARSLAEPIVGSPVVRRARRCVDAAAREGGVCHLWLHPNNLIMERDVRRLRTVLAHVATRREEGAIAVETMGEVAERV